MGPGYWFYFWYVAPISASFTLFGRFTEYKWSPLLCITLILIVPLFIPPSPLGLYAIVATQLVDTATLSGYIRRGARNVFCHTNTFSAVASIILPVSAGTFLLFLFGCKIGLLLYPPAALLFVLLFVLRGRIKSANHCAALSRCVSLVVLSVNAFGLPYFFTATQKKEAESTRFERLAFATLSAGVINAGVAMLSHGPSFLQVDLIAWAMVGGVLGKATARQFKETAESKLLFRAYLGVLTMLGLTTLAFYPRILGLL
jgi:hypothetical protein